MADVSAWLLAACGLVVVGIGVFFVAFRPSRSIRPDGAAAERPHQFLRENPRMADPTPAHILVLYEDSRRGAVAIQQAAELATRADALLTVVAVAVTEPEDTHCCDTRSVYWNGVVQELAAEDLGRARALLDPGTASEFKIVTERSVPVALALEAQRSRADMIVVPSDRGIHPRSRSRRARQVKRRVPDAVVVAAFGSRRPA